MLTRPRRRRDEQGAVAILTALCAVGLCVAAAMVIDLGLMRVDRQVAKSAQDSAALAGVNGLVPNINNATFHPFAGVCSALNYLKANSPDYATFSTTSWSDGAGGIVAGDGCDASMASQVCVPGDRATWARFTGTTTDGRSQVFIQSGYTVTADPVDNLSGGAFPEESLPVYASDSGAVTYAGCDQVAVIISEIRSTTLGAPAAASMGTRVRSVARVKVDPPKSPFALLMLERNDCQVLANTSNGIIDVTGYKTNPGLIHADSDGPLNGGAGCNKSVLLGSKANGIVAHEAPLTGEQGQISTVASSQQSDGIPNVYAGPAPGTNPTTSGLVTREVLDTVYLDHVRSAVSAAVPLIKATTPPAGFIAKPCPNNDTWTETKVFINCPGGVNKDVSLPNATDVIFTGQVAGDKVSMPKATRVYVYGAANPAGMTVGTTFEMNNGTAGTACPTTWDASAQRARLFLRTGDLKANGGTFRACNTTVVIMGGHDNACLPTTTPTYFQTGNVCPGPSSGSGGLSLGGNTEVDWTAPNVVDDDLPNDHPSNVAARPDLEDLALWTETFTTHTLGGGGAMHLMGVFAAPNAHPMKLNGGPAQNVKNSQYVARSLWTTGSGTLAMTPMPSLPVAPPELSFYLAR